MRDLHEESGEQRFPYVLVELCFGYGVRRVGQEGHVIAFHDSLELQPDVIGLDEVAFREVVVPCPFVVPDIWGDGEGKVFRRHR